MTLDTPSTSRSAGTWPEGELEAVGQCPVCGGADRVMLYQDLTDRVFFCAPGRWKLYRCSNCETGYLDPRPTIASIGLAYKTYYTHTPAISPPRYNAEASLKSSLRNGYLNEKYGFALTPARRAGRWIVRLMPWKQAWMDREVRSLPLKERGARLLDIGCGRGDFISQANVLGWDAEGLDPDAAAADVGRQSGLRITTGGLPDTGFASGSFAAVTMSHAIEHVHDPVAALREVYRILQPGGAVWIATPNLRSRGHKQFGGDWRGLEPPRHLVLFSPGSLKAALQAAGFDAIAQARGVGHRHIDFSSYLISQRKDPLKPEGGPRPPWVKRVRSLIDDWLALMIPSLGNEIVFLARRPMSGNGGGFV